MVFGHRLSSYTASAIQFYCMQMIAHIPVRMIELPICFDLLLYIIVFERYRLAAG